MDGEVSENQTQGSPSQRATVSREQDAIYQGDRIVARVLEFEIDMDSKELRMGEIYGSDELVIPDECEFQRFRILIQRIGFATKVDKAKPHKGRILRDVSADILGYREQ